MTCRDTSVYSMRGLAYLERNGIELQHVQYKWYECMEGWTWILSFCFCLFLCSLQTYCRKCTAESILTVIFHMSITVVQRRVASMLPHKIIDCPGSGFGPPLSISRFQIKENLWLIDLEVFFVCKCFDRSKIKWSIEQISAFLFFSIKLKRLYTGVNSSLKVR